LDREDEMSLTILVHRDLSNVAIVRWFLDPKASISYATGPLVQMPWEQFRAGGWNWIRSHFQEYVRVRLAERDVTAVFEPGLEKKFLKDRHAVRIRAEGSGDLTLIPRTFSKYTLAGLESLDKETRRTIPASSSAEDFWKTFDEVLAVASEA
jgi:hypothetical protein